jgi:hypothetical protein
MPFRAQRCPLARKHGPARYGDILGPKTPTCDGHHFALPGSAVRLVCVEIECRQRRSLWLRP